MASTPTLEAMVNELIDQRLRQMQTAYPAEVISYDSTTSTATVMPLFIEAWRDTNDNRIEETIEATEDTYVENVLVAFPRSGAFRMTYPIAPGDTGLVVCTKYALDVFRDGAGANDPGDIRKFTMSGSVFFPVNLYTDDDPLDASDDDAFVTISQGGTSQFVALANLVNAQLSSIQGALDNYDTHIHNVLSDDKGVTDGPSAAHGYTQGDTDGSTLKAD